VSVNNESMALEEFILDLCEESVNAALLVSPLMSVTKIAWLTRPVDILVIPNLSTRPRRKSTIRFFQDL
jgi:hypothetical protein